MATSRDRRKVPHFLKQSLYYLPSYFINIIFLSSNSEEVFEINQIVANKPNAKNILEDSTISLLTFERPQDISIHKSWSKVYAHDL